jgi:3-methyl-2-oxobutanoate hydroxymethyltransferase
VAASVENAERFRREAGCDGVKLEWRKDIEHVARAIVAAGIPVIGHVGLTPQTAAGEGGFGLRGKDAASALRIVDQAKALEGAGCVAMVLECVPDVVAEELTRRLRIPTIGIGSGPACDGQVVVTYDLLGLFDRFKPGFVKRYADLGVLGRQACAAYVEDVQAGRFPGKEQTRTMAAEERAKFQEAIG